MRTLLPLSDNHYRLGLVVVTLLTLLLGSSRDLVALPNTIHDDGHFFKAAVSVLQGQWFGAYDQLTLIKGPFYSLFLVGNHSLGFPLLIGEQLLTCLSGLALVYALSYYCQSRLVLLVVYSAYVWHPITFMFPRITREGIYSSLTTCVIAGGLLLTAGLMGRVTRHQTRHACFAGLSLGGFWLTREEGVCLVPCLLFLLGMGVLSHYRQDRNVRAILWQSRPVLLALVLASSCVFSVALVNYTQYGVFLARSELLSREFSAAYGALLRIQSSTWDAHIPVPQSTRQKLYDVSPRFRTLQPYLEKPETVNGWSMAGCPFYPSTCGDYAGGWFVWALRDAVAATGYTKTAPAALAFYRDLASEVNGLCDAKQLQCGPPHSGTLPPLRKATLFAIPGSFRQALKRAVALPNVSVEATTQQPSGDSSPETQALYTELTRTPLRPTQITYCPRQHYNILGWLNWVGGDVSLPRGDGTLSKQVLPSPDLVTAFHNPQLTNNRFQLDVCCIRCVLDLTDARGRSSTQINLTQGATSGGGTYGNYHLDQVKTVPPLPLDVNTVKLKVLDAVKTVCYQYLGYIAHVLALGVWTVRLVWKRYWSLAFWVATSLLIAIVSRLLLLSLIDVTSFPALSYLYLSPVLALLPVFSLLVFADTWQCVKRPPEAVPNASLPQTADTPS